MLSQVMFNLDLAINAEGITEVMAAGGIEAILGAMRAHSDDARVMRYGSGALAHSTLVIFEKGVREPGRQQQFKP